MSKKTDEIHGFIGQGTDFSGELKFDGTVRIEGNFKGRIHATGTLVVGEKARVEAGVHCGTLITSGEIIGDIEAADRIEARPPGRIQGNIKAPVLVISEGVFFEGQAQMDVAPVRTPAPEKKTPVAGKTQEGTAAGDKGESTEATKEPH
jgi:cytoskeletal protein CcmA (bactofilin family)